MQQKDGQKDEQTGRQTEIDENTLAQIPGEPAGKLYSFTSETGWSLERGADTPDSKASF